MGEALVVEIAPRNRTSPDADAIDSCLKDDVTDRTFVDQCGDVADRWRVRNA